MKRTIHHNSLKTTLLSAAFISTLLLSSAFVTGCSACNKSANIPVVSSDSDADILAKDKADSSEKKPVHFVTTDSAYDNTTLVVYSPHDAEPLNAGIIAFMTKYPNIKVELIAGGTGELCERIASEAASPKADVFWGGGADSMEAYHDYFNSFVCTNDSAIDRHFKDDNEKWIGESPLPMVIIYNKKLLAEEKIAPPKSWNDCLDPKFKGKIAYCQPSKSGSAYTQLCTMILAHGGGEKGWDFVERFAANLDGKILDSSGKCHKLVASGAYLVGITIEKSAVLYKDDPKIGFCYPSDGTSAVPDAISIIKGCPHEENAHTFVNFITSYESQQEQCHDWKRRPARSDVAVPEGLVPMSQIKLVDYNFVWAAHEKEAIIARFNKIMNINN